MFLEYSMLFAFVTPFATCSNILAIVPTPSYSHQVAFVDFWKELSLRGHQVTVITTDPQRNKELTNLTEIDLEWSYKFFSDISNEVEKSMTMWTIHIWFSNVAYNMVKEQLSDHQVQDLIHNRNRKFDVLLVEWFYPEYLGFAEIYKCPTIVISSFDVYLNIHYKIGNPTHPVLLPNMGSPLTFPLNFEERIITTIYSLYTWLFYDYVSFPLKTEVLREFFNVTTTIDEVLDKVDMLFLSVHPIVHPIRAVGPTTINIDGTRQISADPLPKDLAEFLNSATQGFVYFSLGSNVKSKDLQKESLMAILETLGELPFKVLWKFEADPETLSGKPDNVKLVKWAPQLGVLAHPNIKLFVTQGGLQSMEETIFYEVPCVVIPFFADQEQNAKLMMSKGFAEIVERHPYINKESLTKAIKDVTTNPKYKKSVSKLKQLSSDSPMTGLEKAIWWTEYVIRNKGAKHLRNPAADIPLYQYFLLDVIGFLVLATVVILYVMFIVLRMVFSVVKGRVQIKINSSKKLQ